MNAKTNIPYSEGWELLRTQLLEQWAQLQAAEIDAVGPDRERLSQLIQSRYGVDASIVESYLARFAETLPIAA